MKTESCLNKAAAIAGKGNYDEALKLLKAAEEQYYSSFEYHKMYAIIALHAGSFLEALQEFKQARQIKMRDVSVMLGLAVLNLKHLDTVQAVDYYLDVQEIDPKNKIAKKGLEVIKKNSNTEVLSGWATPENLAKLYPPVPSPSITAKTVVNYLLIFAAALLVVTGILAATNVLPNPFKGAVRSSAEFALTREERGEPVEVSGYYRYILTRDQATDLYDRALSLFSSYRDENAKIYLNRIMESNASDAIKNKSRLLMNYMEVPGFDNFRRSDNFSLTDARGEPAVYRNVHVIWQGMATNLQVTDDFTRFDFLVGYDTRRTLEGIVPVVFDRPVAINTERPLEILGRITLLGENMDIMLEGVAVHQSGRLEQ